MSYLSHRDLIDVLPKLDISTSLSEHPFAETQIKVCSIDIRCDRVFWEQRKLAGAIDLGATVLMETSPRRYWRKRELELNRPIKLRPGQLILGRTYERFRIPPEFAGKITGRSSNMKVTHQGRGGFIECDGLQFDIEMMASGPTFAIYFPRRKHDKKLERIRKQIETFVASDPENWEIADYDSPHGLYGGMTVNERLCAAEVINEYTAAIARGDYALAIEILADLDLDNPNVQAVIEEEKKRKVPI